jgi:steroid delta-isomerase-like uncharacterized protein
MSKNVETFMAAHKAFNKRDFDGAVKHYAADAVYHDLPRGLTFKGPKAFTEFMQGWVTAMSNAEVFEPKYHDAGDTVIAEFVGRGTNDGPLGPLPKTGKPLKLHFCEVFQFNKQGQIVDGKVYYDQMSMLVQLGHVQPPK